MHDTRMDSTLPNAATAQAVDAVFLTPRIIDRRAFEDYSAGLQALIREATGQGEALRVTGDDIRALREGLREATRELQQKLEIAVKLIPTLDQRAVRAEQMLATVARELSGARADDARTAARPGAEPATPGAGLDLDALREIIKSEMQSEFRAELRSELRKELQAELSAELGQLGAQLRGEVASELRTRVEAEITQRAAAVPPPLPSLDADAVRGVVSAELAARLGEFSASQEAIRGMADDARALRESVGAAEHARAAAVSAVEDVAGAALVRVREATAAGESSLGAVVTRLDEALERALRREAELTERLRERVAAAENSSGAVISTLEDRVPQLQARCETAAAHLTERVHAAAAQLEKFESTHLPTPEALASLAARAETLHAKLHVSVRELEDSVARVEQAREAAGFAVRQLEQINTQADAARRALGDSINAGAAAVDLMEGKVNDALGRSGEISASIDAAARWMDGAAAQFEQAAPRIEHLGLTMQAHADRITELERTLNGLDERLTRARAGDAAASTRAETNLDPRLLDQAHRVGAQLMQLVGGAHDAARGLDSMTRESRAARDSLLAARDGLASAWEGLGPALDSLAAARESLASLHRELEPWRPLLLERRGDAPLPPALTQMLRTLGDAFIEHARRELARG